MDRVPITSKGLTALKDEMNRRKSQRTSISAEIETAREHGDLKENAEYHAAKEKQGLNEARIADLEDKISRAEVIDLSTLGGDIVKFGAQVVLEDLDSEKQVVYQILGPDEADLENGTISVTSPVARALIGREIGDEVKVKTPGGLRSYEIADIVWKS